jgi:hypothetical protein
MSPHFAIKTEITWKADTNNLGGQFWVYRKLPEVFSREAISNAIVLASLQDKGFPKPSRKTLRWDFDPFRRVTGHPCTFLIEPKNGVITYQFPGFRNGSPEDIPSDEVIVKRAFESARLLGIEPTQLAQKGITTNYCEYDMKGGRTTNNACGRGIILPRRIDGVDFRGEDEGFSIEFGSHCRIRFFSLTWPNLKPYRKHQTATPSQLINCIRHFKTPLAFEGNELNYSARVKALSKATKVTIIKITPYYGEGVYGGNPETGETPLVQLVTPFAELEARAVLDNTNINVTLLSPLLVTEVTRLLSVVEPEKKVR